MAFKTLVEVIQAKSRNIKLTVEYDGTAYNGWQLQNNAPSVQGTIEQALSKILDQECRINGSGRTDSGVHARGQVFNFTLIKNVAMPKLQSALNGVLPRDIVIKSCEPVAADFHARFAARVRTYQYFIHSGRSAIHRNFCWEYYRVINLELLNNLAACLIGEHDFAAFARIQTQTNNKICTVFTSGWRRENNFYIYKISANRFLHGMVRTIVGTQIETMNGRFSNAEFMEIFASKDRNRAGTAAPAKGLFLETVEYDQKAGV